MSDRDSSDLSADAAFDAVLAQVAQTPSAEVLKRPGDSFCGGRYRVERLLGTGGQKVVFLVRDTSLERDCALSLIQPGLVDPAQLERFRLEAQALARFGAHSNIVTIYDLGEEDGLPYVLCEYLEGGDLRAAIAADGPLATERALEIATDVSRALAFAHERDVIHRDVTPANIWLVGDGTAKLGDFGLALVTGQSRLTRPGGVLGTAAYLAPEQAQGKPVDERSDLYSLGCVLYEMLTGSPPFTGTNPVAVVSQHVHAEPARPDEKNVAVDPRVADLVLRLLSKAPEDRPTNARELLDELGRVRGRDVALAATSAVPPPIPDDEADRVAAVHALGILDTSPEPAFDDLAELAAQVCDCPAGYICFIDETRQWMKALYGLPEELAVAPREIGVCQTTICQSDVLVAPDLSLDERFRQLPPVVGPPHFRFYCGAPLLTPQGHALGTICALDFEPREMSFRQIEALRRLSRQVMAQLELMQVVAQLEQTRRRTDALLRNLLPAHVATALAADDPVEPRYHDSVTLGFASIAEFPRLTTSLQPAQLVRTLDEYVSAFDDVVQRHGLEKLKTLGGNYVFAGGLPASRKRHPLDACLGALALREAARRINRRREREQLPPWALRIALHTGPAMSGVVGNWKLAYDVWGQAANVAARMASTAERDRVAISESTFERIKDLFDCEPRGSIDVEDRGQLSTFFLERIKPELARDAGGTEPNERFHELARRRFGDADR